MEGIGEKRRIELHRHFKSMDALRAATVEDIAAVKGMTRPTAERLYGFLHDKPQERQIEGITEGQNYENESQI